MNSVIENRVQKRFTFILLCMSLLTVPINIEFFQIVRLPDIVIGPLRVMTLVNVAFAERTLDIPVVLASLFTCPTRSFVRTRHVLNVLANVTSANSWGI